MHSFMQWELIRWGLLSKHTCVVSCSVTNWVLKKIKPRFLNLNRPRWSDHDFFFFLCNFFGPQYISSVVTWNDDNLILWLHYESRIYISRYLTLSGRNLWQSQPVSYCGSTFPRAAVIPQYSQREKCACCLVFVCVWLLNGCMYINCAWISVS